MSRACLGVLLGISLGMAGCGGADSRPDRESDQAAAQATEPANACSLLTAQEVGAAIGEAFMPGALEEQGTGAGEAYFSVCTFAAQNPSSLASVTVTSRPSPEIEDPAQALDAHVADMRASAMPDYGLTPVELIGASGGWDPSMNQLTVFRRGLMLVVGMSGQVADARNAATALARIALARAP